jgi:hypothetical protein
MTSGCKAQPIGLEFLYSILIAKHGSNSKALMMMIARDKSYLRSVTPMNSKREHFRVSSISKMYDYIHSFTRAGRES